MKKVISLFLSIVMLFSITASIDFSAYAAKCSHSPLHMSVKTVKATTSSDGYIGTYCLKCKTVTEKAATFYKVSSITLSSTSFVYDGKEKKPNVIVKTSKGKTLKNGTDYSVSYSSGRKNVGTYSVDITLKGNYSGGVCKTYNIVPKGTSLSTVTSGVNCFTVNWNKQKTQTSGYEIQYSTSSNFSSGNKTKIINSSGTTNVKITGLGNDKTYYVRIRTFKIINGKKIYSSYSSAKSVVSKSKLTDVTNSLKKKYPTGTSWNSSKKAHGGSGCYAFAATCLYSYTGHEPSAKGSYKNKKFADIKVGDMVHYVDPTWGEHWVFVISKSNSSITVGEGNAYDKKTGKRGVVVWGRTISKTYLDQYMSSSDSIRR